jgi:hypothetical protein
MMSPVARTIVPGAITMTRTLPPGHITVILVSIALTHAVHRINKGVAVIVHAIITDLQRSRIYIRVIVITVHRTATAAIDGVTVMITVGTVE